MTNIYKALANFQQECPTIHKGTKGYSYSYADLPSIFAVINPLLKKNGLGFTQLINDNSIKSVLFHSDSGEVIESETSIPTDVELKGMNAYQVMGSAITYIRRYALSSMLGVVTDKDTDASGQQQPKPKFASPKPSKPELSAGTPAFDKCKEALAGGKFTIDQVKTKYQVSTEVEKLLTSK